MLTLIKREVLDHLVYFIAAALFSAVFVAIGISLTYRDDPKQPPVFAMGLGFPSLTIVILGLCGMGASQMYWDKTRRISAFLSTLPVSRSRILLARIVAGILAILILLVPLAIAAVVLLRLFTPPIPVYSGMLWEISMTTFLLALACYCIGLQTGWNSSALTPSLGALGLACVFVPLVVVKGFGPEIVVIVVLFIAASLVRTWHNFSSTSL
jgi:ABC-type transport system involved in multi-copper enzyme maturation permease subunit